MKMKPGLKQRLRLPATARPILRTIGSIGFWQTTGKIVQIFGFGHVGHCLEKNHWGISGQVMTAAVFLQVALTLGIDVVAVRRVAAKSQLLEELLPVIFTFRLILHLALAALWSAAVLLAPIPQMETAAWLAGGIYFLAIGMNFQWYYQATERMAFLSRVQTLTTFAVSLCFFLFIRPGQAAGGDILVMALVHGFATVWIWERARLESKTSLFWTQSFPILWRRIRELVREGRASWLFTVGYNGLAIMGMLLLPALMGKKEGDTQSGFFRDSYQPCLALQFVLNYVGYIFYPKIVVWRNEQPSVFRPRVVGLAFGAWIVGVLGSLPLLWLAEPLFGLIYREDASGASIFPIMVLAKFIGMSSGFLVWGLLAEHKDWLAVRCCLFSVLTTFLLHFAFIPKYGFAAAGWLYAVGELLLFATCLTAFLRLNLPSSAPK